MKEILFDYLKKVDLMKTLTGITVLMVFAFMVYRVMNSELPEGNREIVIHVLGIMEGIVLMVVGFYYGSSKGSQDKNSIIKQQNETINEKVNS